MLDIILESMRIMVLVYLFFWLWKQGKGSFTQSNHGWNLILMGFSLLIFGSVLDLSDNFESLNWLIILGDTPVEAVLEKLVGFLGGFILLALGLMLWIPTVQQLADETKKRKKVEQNLEGSKQVKDDTDRMLQTVLDAIPVRVFWKDISLNYQGSNTLFSGDAGITSQKQLIGKSDFDMPWKETDAEGYRSDDRDVISLGKAKLNIEEQQLGADGTIKWVNTSKVPLINSSGEIVGILGTYEDITERKQVELNLIEAKQATERASKAKSEFLSSMSHELRTPLNSILGFSELLKSDESRPLDKIQQECVEYISEGGKHLLMLINQVLDLSRIEAEALEISINNIKPAEVFADYLPLLQEQANKKDIELTLFCSPIVTIKADRTLFKQVILNLVSNAIKYNKQGGSVTIECLTIESDYLRISVTDTGEGIPQEKHSQIFTAFSRLGKENSNIEGTGIGLTITKRHVEAMDGHIGFESSEGKGSTFWVELPIS